MTSGDLGPVRLPGGGSGDWCRRDRGNGCTSAESPPQHGRLCIQ